MRRALWLLTRCDVPRSLGATRPAHPVRRALPPGAPAAATPPPQGDGITPHRCAHLEGAEQRDIDAFHIAFVPGLGLRLRGTPWYGSPALVDAWADFLD